jgi:biofilm PGA synthesis N-glycosyltransferase PgaC
MRIAYIIFILSLFILFYNYIGYGLLLWVIVRIKRMLVRTAPAPAPPYEPDVTLVVAAYNEEGIMAT